MRLVEPFKSLQSYLVNLLGCLSQQSSESLATWVCHCHHFSKLTSVFHSSVLLLNFVINNIVEVVWIQ